MVSWFRRTWISPWLPKVHSTCKSQQMSWSASLLIPSCHPPMLETLELSCVLLQHWQRGSVPGTIHQGWMCSSFPLEAQTDTQISFTHCCCGGGDVLGSKGHKIGGLGHASLDCAAVQHKAGLGIASQQQGKVPKAIEGVGESIHSGDVGVPKGASCGPKDMEPFWGKENKPGVRQEMMVSFHGGQQPLYALQRGSVYGHATHPVPWHRGGRALGTHQGWVAHIPCSQPLVSSQQTLHRTGASQHVGSTSQMPPAPHLRDKTAGHRGCRGPHCAYRVLSVWCVKCKGSADAHLPVAG